MKKILISMMTIAMVSALIGGGIYAAFSDTENGGSSAFTTGTVDLTLDGENDTGVAMFSWPNWDGTALTNSSTPVKNIGSLDATLDITFGNVQSTESRGEGPYTADSGSDTTHLTDAALTQADDYWNGYTLLVTNGTGVGSSAVVSDFVAGTDTLTLATALSATPDATTVYYMYTEAEWDATGDTTGTADSGTSTTITDSVLTQADDYWNGYYVVITAGTNVGEVREVSDFNAATDTITVSSAFSAAIDGTSVYALKVGELSSLNVAIWIDGGTINGTYDGGTDDYFLDPTTATITQPGSLVYTNTLLSYSSDAFTGYALNANTGIEVVVDWNSGTGSNNAQGDSLSVQVDYSLSS